MKKAAKAKQDAHSSKLKDATSQKIQNNILRNLIEERINEVSQNFEGKFVKVGMLEKRIVTQKEEIELIKSQLRKAEESLE